MTTDSNRTRQPFYIRLNDSGATIWSGPTDNDVILGAVYDKGPGSYDCEEMAKVWAAAYPIMFPALANIRNVARRAATTDRYETMDGLRTLLAAISKTAGDALPVPTIGDLKGTTPPAPASQPGQDVAGRPELADLMRRSADAVEAMTADEREAMFARQRESWVRGEMAMGETCAAARAVPAAAPQDAIQAISSHALNGIGPFGATSVSNSSQWGAALPQQPQPADVVGEVVSGVLAEVAAERRRQIKVEGWTPEHDDEHTDGEMAAAAATYALHEIQGGWFSRWRDVMWPWNPVWWKPKDRKRDLIRAAALIVAEVERLDRAALRQHTGEGRDNG